MPIGRGQLHGPNKYSKATILKAFSKTPCLFAVRISRYAIFVGADINRPSFNLLPQHYPSSMFVWSRQSSISINESPRTVFDSGEEQSCRIIAPLYSCLCYNTNAVWRIMSNSSSTAAVSYVTASPPPPPRVPCPLLPPPRLRLRHEDVINTKDAPWNWKEVCKVNSQMDEEPGWGRWCCSLRF